MPLAAIRPRSSPASRSGSTTASAATSRSSRKERLYPPAPRSLMTALRVASLPVPAVVGTATNGHRRAGRRAGARQPLEVVPTLAPVRSRPGDRLGRVQHAAAADPEHDVDRRAPVRRRRPRRPRAGDGSSVTDDLARRRSTPAAARPASSASRRPDAASDRPPVTSRTRHPWRGHDRGNARRTPRPEGDPRASGPARTARSAGTARSLTPLPSRGTAPRSGRRSAAPRTSRRLPRARRRSAAWSLWALAAASSTYHS